MSQENRDSAGMTTDDAKEAQRWRDRASRLRWALVDISAGFKDGKTLNRGDLRRIASDAIEYERQESERSRR